MSPIQKGALCSLLAALATLTLKSTGYYLTGSVSVLSDAAETLSNVITALIALGAVSLAAQPADDNHPYGHDKVEYFSSGLEGTLIIVAGLGIAYAGCMRLLHAQEIALAGWGVLLLSLSAWINFATARWLMRLAKQFDSITLEADAKHLMSDVWTSVMVVLALCVVSYLPQWQILDPLAALGIGLMTLKSGFELIKRSINGLMDVALPEPELNAIQQILAELPEGVHHQALRTRKSGARRFIDVVISLSGEQTVFAAHQIGTRLEQEIQAQLPRAQVFIKVVPLQATTGLGQAS